MTKKIIVEFESGIINSVKMTQGEQMITMYANEIAEAKADSPIVCFLESLKPIEKILDKRWGITAEEYEQFTHPAPGDKQ